MGVANGVTLPPDYLERVYAGVLGKNIGVYLGRPFEGWTHQKVMAELGHIRYYVNERLKTPLVVPDDDVSGTYTFVRALEEHDPAVITSEAIGKTWLDLVVEKKSIFWWGGRGLSTEHTAYLNLKHGIPAPQSGSMAINGRTMAEQIGAQIFIDGWALVAPAQPQLAARLAEMAGKVSHDGESVHAAVLWAAMEAEAFVSKDIEHLLHVGLSMIPPDCFLAKVIAEVRQWVQEDANWLKTRRRIEEKYGYDKFPGTCHVIPNHAIMIMSVLYASHDFSEAMHIINTCGWDTDCNSGNVGCLVAIMHGLDSFEGDLDWRGPIADRAIISSADAGYSINNAARIAMDLTNTGRRLAGKAPLAPPKDGAHWHFSLPGSVQGFAVTDAATGKIKQGTNGTHGPGLCVELLQSSVEIMTPTFAPKDLFDMLDVYVLCASPLVYTGQRVEAVVRSAAEHLLEVNLRLKAFNTQGNFDTFDNETITVEPGQSHTLSWTIPAIPESYPIAEIGLVVTAQIGSGGKLWLDQMRIKGVPDMILERPRSEPHTFWDLMWIQSVSNWTGYFGKAVCVGQDSGEGIVACGPRDWTDYQVTSHDFSITLGVPSGAAIRVQGLNRYYALLFIKGFLIIVKALDDQRIELARTPFEWEYDRLYEVRIQAVGNTITGKVEGATISAEDGQYTGGGFGYVVTDGSIAVRKIHVGPVTLS